MRIRILFVVAVAVAAVATTMLPVAEAAEINVGAETTWRIPSDPNFYSSWAARETIVLHDVLVFRFAADDHSVARVTKEAYDNCNTNNPKFVNNTTPFRFRLDKEENYYFICPDHGHCSAGQKLAITNINQRSSTVTPPRPPPNPASAPALSTFTVAFISIAVALIIAS